MQLGTDKWEAAEYLGMTAKQLDDVYGHHHPDHLKGPPASIRSAAKASPKDTRNRTRTIAVERQKNR